MSSFTLYFIGITSLFIDTMIIIATKDKVGNDKSLLITYIRRVHDTRIFIWLHLHICIQGFERPPMDSIMHKGIIQKKREKEKKENVFFLAYLSFSLLTKEGKKRENQLFTLEIKKRKGGNNTHKFLQVPFLHF